MSAKNFTLDEALARIEVLENNKIRTSYSETVLWSGNNWNSGLSITLSQPYTNFDQIIFIGTIGTNYFGSQMYPVSALKVGCSYNHAYRGYGKITINSTTNLTFPDQGDIGITQVIGIKFTNNL